MKDALGFEIVESTNAPQKDALGFTVVEDAPTDVGELRRGEVAAAEPDNRPWFDRSGFNPRDFRGDWGGGFTRSPNETPDEKAAIERASDRVLSTAVGVMGGMAVRPIQVAANANRMVKAAALLGTGAAGGGVQMAAEEATKQLLGASEPSAGKLAWETAKGAAFGAGATGIAGAALSGGARLVGAAKEALAPGLDRGRRAVASLWPSVRKPLSDAQERAAEARSIIQTHTGVEVPIGVSEAIGHPEMARKLASPTREGVEFTADEQDAVKRLVSMAAVDLRGANPSPQELGQRAIQLFEDEIGRISTPARAAVQQVSDELHPAITKANDEIQNAAMAWVPGTPATPTQLGQAMRRPVQEGLHGLTDEAQAAYTEAKKLAPPNVIPVTVGELKTATAKLNFETPHTEPSGVSSAGRPIATLVPSESRKYVSEIAGASDEWTLQQALRVRSEIGRAIGDNELLPGIGRGDLKQMYAALTKDIETALAPGAGSPINPKALAAWRTAWGKTKETSERFNFRLVSDIVDEFGREGGTGPAAIASKMTTAEAPSVIAAMEKAAGPTHAPELHRSIREYLFNHVGNGARNPATGEVSVGDLLGGITKLAPEVQSRYFPGASAVAKLANREAALAGLTKTTTGDAAKAVAGLEVTDPTLLAEALGPKASAEVTRKLQLALSERAKEAALYKGTVLGRLKAGDADGIADAAQANPTKFVRSIVDGTFSAKEARTAINLLKAHDPEVFRSLQFHFVDHVLNKFQTEVVGINTPRIASELRPIVSSGSARSDVSEMAQEVLGPEKLGTLRRMMEAFAELDRQGGQITAQSPLADIGARVVGGAIGATGAIPGLGAGGAAYQANFVTRYYRKIMHRFGGYLLTTPELRRLALTPIDRLTPGQMNDVSKGFASFVLTQVPEGSEEAHQAEQLARDAAH